MTACRYCLKTADTDVCHDCREVVERISGTDVETLTRIVADHGMDFVESMSLTLVTGVLGGFVPVLKGGDIANDFAHTFALVMVGKEEDENERKEHWRYLPSLKKRHSHT